MDLNPLDFEEWLWATDGSGLLADAIDEAFRARTPLPDALHKLAMRSLREYLLVGGMPQSIQAYGADKDFFAADQAKRQILDVYRSDMFKYGGNDAAKVAAIFDQIPGQLSRHEKRFVMASLGSEARYREYAEAVFWLGDSHIANICRKSSDPSVGFGLSSMENDFKCYLADTGMLVTSAFSDRDLTQNPVYATILSERLGINEGMLVENYVAQQLKASGNKLFYYSSYRKGDPSQTMEIDFLVVREFDNAAFKPRVSPIEVKSTSRYSTKSLDKFKDKFQKRVGTQYVLHPRRLKSTASGSIFLYTWHTWCRGRRNGEGSLRRCARRRRMQLTRTAHSFLSRPSRSQPRADERRFRSHAPPCTRPASGDSRGERGAGRCPGAGRKREPSRPLLHADKGSCA